MRGDAWPAPRSTRRRRRRAPPSRRRGRAADDGERRREARKRRRLAHDHVGHRARPARDRSPPSWGRRGPTSSARARSITPSSAAAGTSCSWPGRGRCRGSRCAGGRRGSRCGAGRQRRSAPATSTGLESGLLAEPGEQAPSGRSSSRTGPALAHIRRRSSGSGARAARPLGRRRRRSASRPRRVEAVRRPRGGRRRSTRAASSTPAGWRRGRRWPRTRRPRRGRRSEVAPSQVGGDAAHQVVGGRRHRDRVAGQVEAGPARTRRPGSANRPRTCARRRGGARSR